MIGKIFGSVEHIAYTALILALVNFGLVLAALSIALVCLLGAHHGVQ